MILELVATASGFEATQRCPTVVRNGRLRARDVAWGTSGRPRGWIAPHPLGAEAWTVVRERAVTGV